MRKKRILTEEHKKKISESQKGLKKKFSEQAIENIRIAAAKRRGIKKGRPSQETIEKIRLATIGKSKTLVKENPTTFKKGHIPLCPFKKGHIPWNKGMPWDGKYKEILIVSARKRRNRSRHGIDAREWSFKVRERDGNVCTRCSSTQQLHAHHIIPWKESVELRFELSNGITLCNSCHLIEENKVCPRIKWPFGSKFSDEHRKKMSESHRKRLSLLKKE